MQKLLNQVQGKVGNVREGAQHTFGRITAPIDAGVTTALHRLGVPTRKEIGLLTKRVEELTKSVEKTHHARRPRRGRPGAPRGRWPSSTSRPSGPDRVAGNIALRSLDRHSAGRGSVVSRLEARLATGRVVR